jgi:hypothetical protein
MNANNINKASFPERDLLEFFLKVCFALRTLHTYETGHHHRAELEDDDDDGSNDLQPYGNRLKFHHYDYITHFFFVGVFISTPRLETRKYTYIK